MATVAAILAHGWPMMGCFQGGLWHQLAGGRVETVPASSPSRRLCFGSLGFKATLIGVVLGTGEVSGGKKLVRPQNVGRSAGKSRVMWLPRAWGCRCRGWR